MQIRLPFRPPLYKSMEENFQANLVHKIAWAWIITVTALCCAIAILIPEYWLRQCGAIFLVTGASVICLLLNRQGHTRPASIIYSVLLWVLATGFAATSGGIKAPVISSYVPVIITTGYLVGSVAGVGMAALCILSSLVFVILDVKGLMPPKHIVHTPLSTWVTYTLPVLTVTVIQYWVVRHIHSSFQTIEKETDERQQTEARLRESEFNNRMVVQNKILGIAWASPAGNVLNASDTFCDMLGYPLDELKGVYFGDFTHPEDVPRELVLFEQIINKERDSYTIEKRYRRKNGEYIWVELNLTGYRNAVTGAADFYIGIVQNIQLRKQAEAALKESEEKYRYLFNNNPSFIFIWDLETLRLLEVNETALNEYGYTRDEILKMTVMDLRLPGDHEKIKNFADKMLAGSENKTRGIWKHLKKNGDLMYMDISSHRIIYKNRPAILSLAENVTEKVNIEEKLKKSYEDIRLLNAHMETVREEERTRIAREIHDELGQQLTALKMDASWVSKKANPNDKEVQRKFADIFLLIDDTIKTVRKISSDLRPSLLDDLGLQAALEWLSNEFEKRTGIRCRLDIKLNDYYFEKEHCTGIFRVYQEALTNVTRHAGATQVDATLEIRDGQAVLTVKDNGVGFNTADAENKNTFGLLGMEERAHMLKGELKIESEKGKGTTVILKVPLTNATVTAS